MQNTAYLRRDMPYFLELSFRSPTEKFSFTFPTRRDIINIEGGAKMKKSK
jgi:hypothetical protein